MTEEIHGTILILSAYFPPDGEVGGRRVARIARHLPEHGYFPVVLTLPSIDGKNHELPTDFGSCQIHRVAPLPNPATWPSMIRNYFSPKTSQQRKLQSAQGISPGVRNNRTWQYRLREFFITPDRFVWWYRPALKRAREILRGGGITHIFSSAPPWTCHLIARTLRNEFPVKWIADFRDPWMGHRLVETRPFWRRSVEYRLESACVSTADVIVCNTRRIEANFRARFPNLKTPLITIPNGFEPQAEPRRIPAPQERKLLLHLGTIYGLRRIDTFCAAVESLETRGEISFEEVKLLFLGETEKQLLDPARAAAPTLFQSGSLEFRGKVPWNEAQEWMWQADIHLIFQGGYTEQVPAKFYECLQTHKPILAIAFPGELTDLMDELHVGAHASPDDPEEIAEKLISCLRQLCPTPEPTALRDYHWTSLVARLTKEIGSLA